MFKCICEQPNRTDLDDLFLGFVCELWSVVVDGCSIVDDWRIESNKAAFRKFKAYIPAFRRKDVLQISCKLIEF